MASLKVTLFETKILEVLMGNIVYQCRKPYMVQVVSIFVQHL